jgi:putative MATE family efflux protein
MVAAVTSAIVWLSIPAMLVALGATGRTATLATSYLHIIVPSIVPLAAGMTLAGVLRSVGDARRAMHVTLVGAAVNVALDPLLIFGAGLGIEGAAIASSLARLAVVCVGFYGASRIHDLIGPLSLRTALSDAPRFLGIAVPAVLTNIATPAANAYVTAAIAPFGDEAVAASAIVGRVIPVAFGVIFSLSGAVGPIIGQNFGARRFDRVRDTLRDGLIVSAIYTLVTSALLFVFRNEIPHLFKADGLTIHLVTFFCTFIAISWAFAGAQFVANAAFNNLGRPNLSTLTNWGKATLGTIPPAYYGAQWYGPEGVMAGIALGSVVFGLVSVVWAYRIANQLEKA